jgi:hypothetical protein
MVAVTITFIDAFNSGDVAAALALLSSDAVGGDCDYRAQSVISFRGHDGFADWLTARRADHDRILVDHFFNRNPDSTSGLGLGLEGVTRSNDTLRSLGYSAIEHTGIPKVAFASDGIHIRGFAFGSPESCKLAQRPSQSPP